MKNIYSYPIINNKLINLAGISLLKDKTIEEDYLFFYPNSYHSHLKNNFRLIYEKYNNEIYLKDPNCIWNKDEYDLDIRATVQIENPSILFGIGGITSSNSKIKVILKWYSNGTYGFNTSKNGSFVIENTESFTSGSLSVVVPKEKLGDDIEIEIEFITYDCDNNIPDNEKYLQHSNGDILGSIFKNKVILVGDGSSFPIISKHMGKHEPLWRMDLSYGDFASEEKLTKDVFCLYLNEDHKDYELLDISNFLEPSPLFKEVFSTAMSQAIIDLKIKDELNANKEREIIHGSILEAILYFIDVFEIKTNTIEDIIYSVKKGVDSKL